MTNAAVTVTQVHISTEAESIIRVLTGWVSRAVRNNGGQLHDPHCWEADAAQLEHLLNRAERWLTAQQQEVSA